MCTIAYSPSKSTPLALRQASERSMSCAAATAVLRAVTGAGGMRWLTGSRGIASAPLAAAAAPRPRAAAAAAAPQRWGSAQHSQGAWTDALSVRRGRGLSSGRALPAAVRQGAARQHPQQWAGIASSSAPRQAAAAAAAADGAKPPPKAVPEKIGFIGAGQMGEALIRGFLRVSRGWNWGCGPAHKRTACYTAFYAITLHACCLSCDETACCLQAAFGGAPVPRSAARLPARRPPPSCCACV